MNLAGSFARLPVGLWLDDLKLGIRDGLKRASGWGLDGVGLDALGPELLPRTLSATGRKDLAQRLRAAGLRPLALRADVGGRRLADTKTLDVSLERLREAVNLARDLGAPFLVAPLGYVRPAGAPEGAAARQSLSEAVRALANFGSGRGVRPVALAGSEPPADLLALLNEEDAGGLFGVDFNPGALVSRGLDPLAMLSVLAPRVWLASAADFYRGGGEAPFGRGDVAWGELMVGLSTLPGQEPPALLASCARECDRVAALSVAVERLKKLRANPLAHGGATQE